MDVPGGGGGVEGRFPPQPATPTSLPAPDHGPRRRPLVVVNGQLEHLRNGFYPPFFYPRLAAAMKGFLPRFDQAFFLHNYDVAGGGAV